jgi:hypothetical protein
MYLPVLSIFFSGDTNFKKLKESRIGFLRMQLVVLLAGLGGM